VKFWLTGVKELQGMTLPVPKIMTRSPALSY